MAETPYVETNALLAVMNEDEGEALRLLREMLPGERASLVRHLDRLSALADDRLRCRGCEEPVIDQRDGIIYIGRLGGPRAPWHRDCLDGMREGAAQGSGADRG